jgi:phosphoglucosamine mutase
MYPDHLAAKVKQYRADLGIAHDGDADRVLMCDENGAVLDGDDIMAICALDMLANKQLEKKTLVATVMSNAGLDIAIQKAGGKVVRTPVGDKNVIDEMLRHGYNFGGEDSGHLIFGEHSSTGDGLVAALQVLATMKQRKLPLSKLRDCWTRFPKKVVNIQVKDKPPFEEMAGVMDLVKKAAEEVKPQGGRVLLRYSGTEPKARLLIESSEIKTITKWCDQIADAIKKQIGA